MYETKFKKYFYYVFGDKTIWRQRESTVPKIKKVCTRCTEFVQQSLLYLVTKQIILSCSDVLFTYN